MKIMMWRCEDEDEDVRMWRCEDEETEEKEEDEDEDMKLDFFQCEIGCFKMLDWISSNVKLDFFQCEIGFVPMWIIFFF